MLSDLEEGTLDGYNGRSIESSRQYMDWERSKNRPDCMFLSTYHKRLTAYRKGWSQGCRKRAKLIGGGTT